VKSDMQLTIREMKSPDREMWLGMYRQLWPGHTSDALRAEIDRILKSAKRAGFVAETSGEAVGFAEYALRDYANGCHSQPVPFLEGIWVAEAFRARGVARKLFEFLERKARAAGYREFGSDVDIDNYSSQLMHERLGFVATERVVFYRKVLD
jgi:aminoglycoside 6'-N-acetyltransferase I